MNQKKETYWQTGLIQGPGVTRDGAIGKDGVIVLSGDNGLIYRSPDNGKNWQVINTGLGDWFHLYGVATDGNGRFVAVGRGRVILMSDDNGLTWTIVQKRSSDRSIYKVAFGKNNLVIAADEEIGYYVSNDGGLTWTQSQHRKIKALRTIDYLDNKFYAGTPSAVWRSADGVAWSRVETNSAGARVIAYNEKNHTFFAGGHAISRSTDDGNTWEQVFDLAPIYGEDANIMGIACFDDNIICTGGDMLTLISKDNGTNWGQLGFYPAKGGFFGLLQAGDRVLGIGTFAKASDPVCFLEKTIMEEVEIPPRIPAPTPNPTPTPTPTPNPTPTPTPTPTPPETPTPFTTLAMVQYFADELEMISTGLIRMVNYLRKLEGGQAYPASTDQIDY